MSEALPVDAVALRDEVRAKYRDVAVNPHGTFHFHIGRPLARHLGYDEGVVARMPENAIEAFAFACDIGDAKSVEAAAASV